MICPICDANIPDDSAVCRNCGEAFTAVAEKKSEQSKSHSDNSKKTVKNNTVKHNVKKKMLGKKAGIIKLIGILIIIAAIIIGIVLLIIYLTPSKEMKIFNGISDKLGRSVTIAENNVGITLKKDSQYSILHEILAYDYIFESEKMTKVGGINLPEWAVYVQTTLSKTAVDTSTGKLKDEMKSTQTNSETENSSETTKNNDDENDLNVIASGGDNKDKENSDLASHEVIESVTLYNFKVLNKNWKGIKTNNLIDIDQIQYGMQKKKAEKIIGISPLFIKHSNTDITTYCYKYYYVDEQTQNEKALYLEVNYSASNTVKSVNSRQNDYVSFLFK